MHFDLEILLQMKCMAEY